MQSKHYETVDLRLSYGDVLRAFPIDTQQVKWLARRCLSLMIVTVIEYVIIKLLFLV